MITHLEPDILECEVKWALGRITGSKASGGDGIPVELFQILKDDAVNCFTQYVSKLGNSAVATGLGNVSFQSNPKERQCQRMLKVKVKSLSHVQLFETPWTVAYQVAKSQIRLSDFTFTLSILWHCLSLGLE